MTRQRLKIRDTTVDPNPSRARASRARDVEDRREGDARDRRDRRRETRDVDGIERGDARERAID